MNVHSMADNLPTRKKRVVTEVKPTEAKKRSRLGRTRGISQKERAFYQQQTGHIVGDNALVAPPGGIEPVLDAKDRRARRIDHIVRLMATPPIRWSRGVTAPLLAKVWGVSLDYVEELSAEASRIVRRDVTDKEVVRQTIGVYLTSGMGEAYAQGKHSAVTRYAQTLSNVIGVAPRESTPGIQVNTQVNVDSPKSPGVYTSLASMAPKQLVEGSGSALPSEASEAVLEPSRGKE